jgi:hypothetical protein
MPENEIGEGPPDVDREAVKQARYRRLRDHYATTAIRSVGTSVMNMKAG